MSAPAASAIRFRLDPRDVPPAKAARLLGLTLGEFKSTLPRLRQRGFPLPDPDTGHYDLKAVEAWMDRRSPLTAGDESREPAPDLLGRIARMRGG